MIPNITGCERVRSTASAAPWVEPVVAEFDATMLDEPRLRSLFRAASATARRRHLTTLLKNLTRIPPGRRVALLLSAVPLEKLTNAQRDLIGHHLLSLLLHHG